MNQVIINCYCFCAYTILKKMLSKGYLSTNLFYVSAKYYENILNKYFKCLNETFNDISKLSIDHKLLKCQYLSFRIQKT